MLHYAPKNALFAFGIYIFSLRLRERDKNGVMLRQSPSEDEALAVRSLQSTIDQVSACFKD